jgi:hypothetical protein
MHGCVRACVCVRVLQEREREREREREYLLKKREFRAKSKKLNIC